MVGLIKKSLEEIAMSFKIEYQDAFISKEIKDEIGNIILDNLDTIKILNIVEIKDKNNVELFK
mgnify:CR=1 FL=1